MSSSSLSRPKTKCPPTDSSFTIDPNHAGRTMMFVAVLVLGMVVVDSPARARGNTLTDHVNVGPMTPGDQLFVLNVRHQPSDLCNVRVPVNPIVQTVDMCRRTTPSTMDAYRDAIDGGRPTVIYVHGNRYTDEDAIEHGLYVYRNTARRIDVPINWVIWSWPSDRDGILGKDVRLKAQRTDGQAFLLASLLESHLEMATPTTLIGFSFGGRVITGGLHALAGGSLRGVVSAGNVMRGGQFHVGLIAPAIEQNWLAEHGYHRLATQNINELTVLYNSRDAVLKRFWLIDRVRGQMALGYSGPRTFAPRFDGTPLPVQSKDCSAIVGLQHDETDYYGNNCHGGVAMAALIRDSIAAAPTQILPIESSVQAGAHTRVQAIETVNPNVMFSRPMLVPTISE